MDWLLQAAIILGMFVLRLGVPLVITLAIGYWLRRLDAKWQAEAQAQRDAILARQEATIEPEVELLKVIKGSCWAIKGCLETVYPHCPAYHHPEIPCWLARFRTEGIIPTKCYCCPLFSQKQANNYLFQGSKPKQPG
jgi:hypothetical protein